MLEACEAVYPSADAAIFTAAVSDWRPAEYSPEKIKSGKETKQAGEKQVSFVANPDIAATLGATKRAGQVQVVYAAETENVLASAHGKLERKNADLCVANDVSGERGFASADNEVWFVTADGEEKLPVMGKRAIARKLVDKVRDLLG